MFRKKLYWIALGVLVVWFLYSFLNKEYFIQEHLTNNNPTLYTLQKDLDTTNASLTDLKTEVENMKKVGQAQGQQAAAAQASLGAIPTGYNDIIPTK
jgi:cell division protein FtsB